MLNAFLKDDSGAVTVDWTVLTGAMVGLGIATYGVVSSGISDLSGDTASHLGRPIIRSAFLTPEDFSSGAGNWVGAGTRNVVGFGDVLGPLRGDANGSEQVFQVFEIPGGAWEVDVGFDLLSLDSIDGGPIDKGWGANEGPVLYLNGQEIARASSLGGNLTWTSANTPGVTIESKVVQSGTNIGGMSPNSAGWKDGINNVRIKFDDPQEDVQIGFGFKANQSIYDESIAIDNFTFEAL